MLNAAARQNRQHEALASGHFAYPALLPVSDHSGGTKPCGSIFGEAEEKVPGLE